MRALLTAARLNGLEIHVTEIETGTAPLLARWEIVSPTQTLRLDSRGNFELRRWVVVRVDGPGPATIGATEERQERRWTGRVQTVPWRDLLQILLGGPLTEIEP